MPEITQVLTEADYDMALARISELLDAGLNTPEGEELDRISTLVEIYEAEHYPTEEPEPSSLIEFMLDQAMVTREQLIPLAGSNANLDAILAAQKDITPEMAQLLHERSGVPVQYFLKAPAHSASSAASD